MLLLGLVVTPAAAQTPAGAPPYQFQGRISMPPAGAAGGDDRPDLSPPGYRFYGNVDYLMWWTEKDRPVAPLTGYSGNQGNISAPQQNDFGPLFRNGLHGAMGIWLNSQQTVGLEMGGFWVDDRSPASGFQAGDLTEASRFRSALCGAEAQLRAEIFRGTWMHFDVLAGFRFISLDEALAIEEHDVGAAVGASDSFGTHNRFYGGDLGGELFFHYEKCFLDLWGKAALGVNDETFELSGTTVAGGQTTAGGILAPPAIVGRHHRDAFAVAPEVGVNVGYECTQHLRFSAGYTFLDLSNVTRPGTQINSFSHAPLPTAFLFQSSSFWVQGLNLGVEFRF